MTNFENKRALVTGAGQGIGRGIAVALYEQGATVFALSKTKENLDSLLKDYPGIVPICVDVREFSNCDHLIADILPLDILVNNAGTGILASCLKSNLEGFDTTFNTNVKSAMNITQIVAKDMINKKIKGSIVNMSSQASQKPLADHMIYCSSKAALDMMTRCFAKEFGQHGIRVNAVNPTVVLTALGKLAWSDPARSGPMLENIPLAKFATIQDVVDAVLFLLSEKSSMINGHCLPVDGGYLGC